MTATPLVDFQALQVHIRRPSFICEETANLRDDVDPIETKMKVGTMILDSYW